MNQRPCLVNMSNLKLRLLREFNITSVSFRDCQHLEPHRSLLCPTSAATSETYFTRAVRERARISTFERGGWGEWKGDSTVSITELG